MSILLLMAVAAVLAAIGRRVFGSWYNPLTHYSVIWGISLSLFELRLIEYYPLEVETWIMIAAAWLALATGALVAPLGGYASTGPIPDGETPSGDKDAARLRAMRWAIIVLTGIAAAAVVQHWMLLIARFGSVLNVIVLGNLVYSLRLSEGLEPGIPYLDTFALAAALFGGVYAALRRRMSLLAILPFLVVIAEAVGGMGRMKIIISIILFITGYFLTSWRHPAARGARVGAGLRKWAFVALAIALFAFGAEIVRSNRGVEETIPGASRSLETLKDASFLTPSVYMYLTVHHGVFNQYLKRNEEHALPGANLFAPVYRVISSFGLDTKISQYQKFYPTPVNANTASWLRDIHSDFGAAGVFIVPFLVGLAASVCWARFRDSGSLASLAILAHLFVLIDLSTMLFGARFGYWLLSLLVSIAVSRYVERAGHRTAVRETRYRGPLPELQVLD